IGAELASGPPAQQSYAGSPVEAVVKASGKVNAVDQSKISAAFSKGRRTVWRVPLESANIWVWKSDPEDVLASLPNCVSTINATLAALSSSLNPLALSASQAEVRGWLHNNASEPETHEAVVSALIRSGNR